MDYLCKNFIIFQKSTAIWLMMLFLFLMHLPSLPVSSIPLLLLVVFCITDWHEISAIFKEYKLIIALILIALLIGIIFSYKPEKSIKGVYDFLRGVVIFFPAIFLVRKYPEKIQPVLVWSGFACSVMYLGYVIYAIFFVSGHLGEQRAFLQNVVGHYNVYGTSVALIVYVAISSFLYLRPGMFERCVLMLTAGIGSWMLLSSGSRGSVVSLFVSLSILILIRFRRRFLLVAAGVGMTLLALWSFIFLGFAEKSLQAWARGPDVTSGRLEIYASILNDVWQHAKFFGFGVNTYKYLDYGQTFNSPLFAPHSVYLECLFSVGIIGSLFMLAAVIALVKRTFVSISLDFYPSLGFGLVLFLLTRGLVDMKLFGVYYPGALAIAFAFLFSGKDQSASSCVPDYPGRSENLVV